MATIFTKIINGEIPCYKIAENDQFIAFLDAFPLMEGHTLVVPKAEIDYIFDLSDELLSEIMTFARPVAKAIEQAIPCQRIAVAVIGLEVPHAHVHLMPIQRVGDVNFTNVKPTFTKEQFEATAAKIKAALDAK
jgi:histidine triad (HIT) family protein